MSELSADYRAGIERGEANAQPVIDQLRAELARVTSYWRSQQAKVQATHAAFHDVTKDRTDWREATHFRAEENDPAAMLREIARQRDAAESERDRLRADLKRAADEFNTLASPEINRLRAECARKDEVLREAAELLRLCDPEGKRLVVRASEDRDVAYLCERWGYGAVMDSAYRQWRAKPLADGGDIGAHTCGPAVGSVQLALKQINAALSAPVSVNSGTTGKEG